jgi:nitronate monooxygenase
LIHWRVKPKAIRTVLTERVGLEYPIIQAPLAGGGDTPELAAAVSNSGGLGFIGAAYLTREQILAAAREVRVRTSRPWGINLFAPTPIPSTPTNLDAAVQRIATYTQELGLPASVLPVIPKSEFEEQLAGCLESEAPVFSFTFGLLPPSAMEKLKASKTFVMGTATTVEEAIALEQAGVDAIVAQGSEAGGHRGTFAGSFESGMVGTIALVPQIVDAVKVPVVASGGIMDGRGIAAALVLGAAGVQMGTAFLACEESGISEAYRSAILSAHEDQTRVTRAFSGRPARGILNRFMTEMEQTPDEILPFPWQNNLTRALRREASRQNRSEYLSLWAGQGVRMAKGRTAAELVQGLVVQCWQAMRMRLS